MKNNLEPKSLYFKNCSTFYPDPKKEMSQNPLVKYLQHFVRICKDDLYEKKDKVRMTKLFLKKSFHQIN